MIKKPTTIYEKIDYKLDKIENKLYEKAKEEINHTTIGERYRGKSFMEKAQIILKIITA